MTSLGVAAGDGAFAGLPDPLDGCLRSLLDAADAADALGLPTAAVREARDHALRRIGFPGDAYVLALVGGTGVGKSSLLNALAGEKVSPASARRPTTGQPMAWAPADQRAALAPLLDWLGVQDVREHRAHGLGSVAILDLPDMDSIVADHRARVEAILPRVDAVAWVTDPEKYHDATLHDEFLRRWLPRLARQVVIVNKADRLSREDARRVRADLEADMAQARTSGPGRPAAPVGVILTSAAKPEIEELRRWLADGRAAKAVVRGRIAATAVELANGLARDAGADPMRPATPYLDARARSAAVEAATSAVLRAVDLPGLERQAVAATRARARARGAGPMGRITSLLYRASGRDTHVADPQGFLVRWRDRSSLAPAVEALRAPLAVALRSASPAVRGTLAATLEPTALRRSLERAVDGSIGALGPLDPPTSRWWSVIGFLQTLSTAGIALSAGWIVVWILGAHTTTSVQIPVLGPVPSPLTSLVVFVIAGYVVARLLGVHAGWIGRRWARRLRDHVGTAVRAEVNQRGLAPLDAVEDARLHLWIAASGLIRTCGHGRMHGG